MAKKITVEKIEEMNEMISELIYLSKKDAWTKACQWIINLKPGDVPDCEKAFEDYINGK